MRIGDFVLWQTDGLRYQVLEIEKDKIKIICATQHWLKHAAFWVKPDSIIAFLKPREDMIPGIDTEE